MQFAGRLKDKIKAAATGIGDKVKATPYGQGFTAATAQMEKAGDYSHSIIPGLGGSMDFYKEMAAQGVSPKQPIKFAGALGARLLTDMGEDATRTAYWRVNHPMAALDMVSDQVLGDRLQKAMPNPTMRAATTLGRRWRTHRSIYGCVTTSPTSVKLGRPQRFCSVLSRSRRGRQKGNKSAWPRNF